MAMFCSSAASRIRSARSMVPASCAIAGTAKLSASALAARRRTDRRMTAPGLNDEAGTLDRSLQSGKHGRRQVHRRRQKTSYSPLTQASTGPCSFTVRALPRRSTRLPTARRTQPSEMQYSSTLVFSSPLKRTPMPFASRSASWNLLSGSTERRSGMTSVMAELISDQCAALADPTPGSKAPFKLDLTPGQSARFVSNHYGPCMSDLVIRDFIAPAADGYPLSIRLVSAARPTVAVLVSSGTGFPKGFYDRFARHL